MMPSKPPTHQPYPREPRSVQDAEYNRRRYAGPNAHIETLRRGGRWAKVRKIHIDRHPLCAHCYAEGIVNAKSLQVHHIIGVHENPSRMFDLTNLLTVCPSCHARIHAQEQNG